MKQQMIEFLKRNNASKYVRIWAKKNCSSLQDCWNRASPERLIWLATCEGVLDDVTLCRFACFCARQVWNLLTEKAASTAVAARAVEAEQANWLRANAKPNFGEVEK